MVSDDDDDASFTFTYIIPAVEPEPVIVRSAVPTTNIVSPSFFYTPISSFHTPISSFRTPISSFRTPISSFQTPGTAFRMPISSFQTTGAAFQTDASNFMHFTRYRFHDENAIQSVQNLYTINSFNTILDHVVLDVMANSEIVGKHYELDEGECLFLDAKHRINETVCPICYEQFENTDVCVLLQNCDHCYHSSCLRHAIHHDHTKCPICREPVRIREKIEV